MSETSPTFDIAQIFLLKAELSYRGDPLSLPPDSKFAGQKINVSVTLRPLIGLEPPLGEGVEAAQVLMRVATYPENVEEKALYDFVVEVAAVTHQKTADKDRIPDTLLVEAVGNMLYPFVRETVANLTMRGRFGPVWLRPINVRDLIRNSVQPQPDEAAPTEGT